MGAKYLKPLQYTIYKRECAYTVLLKWFDNTPTKNEHVALTSPSERRGETKLTVGVLSTFVSGTNSTKNKVPDAQIVMKYLARGTF